MTTGYSPETETSGIHKTRLNDEREVVDIDATDSSSCRKRDQKAREKQIPSAANDGSFSNYPEIMEQTVKNLIEKGIKSLFPI